MALKHVSRSLSGSNDGSTSRRRSILPSMSWKQTSDLEIVLDGKDEFIHSYSTFDAITGHVNIRFEKHTCVDDFSITLQGQAATWVERVASVSPTMGRTTGRHTFLKVQQPIDETCLPEHGRALAGVTYTVPFKFIVPDRILDFTCNHSVKKDATRSNHLLLPPSIGDPMLSGSGMVLMDDLAPDMARISYSIRAGLFKTSPSARKPEFSSESKGLRILPAREELPPIIPNPKPVDGSTKYHLRREKNVRRGIFKIGKKQGRISAESTQPSSLKLLHPSQEADEPPTTISIVKLRFDPTSADEQPPSLNNITSKIRVHTFYGAAPWSDVPAPDSYDTWSTVHSQYPDSVDLSTLDLTSVEWAKHEAKIHDSVPRRGSRAMSKSCEDRVEKHSVTIGVLERSHSNSTRSPISRQPSYLSATSGSDADSTSASTSSSLSSSASAHEASAICSPSSLYDPSLPYYTASITVPITLPCSSPSSSSTSPIANSPLSRRNSSIVSSSSVASMPASPSHSKKAHVTFIPTFHSCLISRVYSLDLALSLQSASNLNLRVPVQLTLPYTSGPADDILPDYSDFSLTQVQPPPQIHSQPGSRQQSTNNENSTAVPTDELDTAQSEAGEAGEAGEDEDEILARTLQTRLNSDFTIAQQRRVFFEDANRPPPPPLVQPQARPANEDLPPEYSMHSNGRTRTTTTQPSPFRALRNMSLPTATSSSAAAAGWVSPIGTRRPSASLTAGHWHLL